MSSAFLDEEFVRYVGLYEQVETCLTDSKWKDLLTLQCEKDVEDTCEFLASFIYVGCTNGNGIRYRHRGQWAHVSMERVRMVFGWQAGGGKLGIHRPLELVDTWAWMKSSQALVWSPSMVSGRYIAKPLFYYLQ